MSKIRLFTPGPTSVPEEILLEMAQPIFHHRTSQYRDLLKQVTQGLQYVFRTSNEVLTFTGSGTSAMEAGIVCCLAPTDKALAYDVEMTKAFGFNAIRKHVKIEPPRWYYHCDRVGMLVWQDMPSGDRGIGGDDPDLERSAESAAQFSLEMKAMIDGLRKLPAEQLEAIKAIYNIFADSVETVTPFLAKGVLANTETGAEITWLTEEKIQERLNSDEYIYRDLFSRYEL